MIFVLCVRFLAGHEFWSHQVNNHKQSPMTEWYWQQVSGTLIPEFRAVKPSETCGHRDLDGVIIKGGESRKARQDEVEIEGRDIIVVQTEAKRLGMCLAGQAHFSLDLMLRHNPRSVESIALVSENDSVIGPLFERRPGCSVVVCPRPSVNGPESVRSGAVPCRKHAPMTEWYWQQVGGTLIPKFRAVNSSLTCSQQTLDAVIIKGGESRKARQGEVEIEGRDIIVVQSEAKRLGMWLAGLAHFSMDLMLRHKPRSVESIALATASDSVIGPLFELRPGCRVVVCPPHVRPPKARRSRRDALTP
jgi:hypothetical protein